MTGTSWLAPCAFLPDSPNGSDSRRAAHESDRSLHREAGRTRGHRLARSDSRRSPSRRGRSEEHTSELQSLMRISYAVFCLKKKTISEIHTVLRRSLRVSLSCTYHILCQCHSLIITSTYNHMN